MITIPTTLDECVDEISKIPEIVSICKQSKSSDEFCIMLHHTFGRWIRNNWNLWKGCLACKLEDAKLYYWFYNIGLFHPDDMSSIILEYYWCRYNNKTFNLIQYVEHYQKFWKESRERELNKITDAVDLLLESY